MKMNNQTSQLNPEQRTHILSNP